MSVDGIEWGRCPKCLSPRPGDPKGKFGLSFAGPCPTPECGYKFIPEKPTPTYSVLVCPICGNQQHPSRDHHSGLDRWTSCHHAHPGERGTRPQWVRIEVVPSEPFELEPIPHDRKNYR